MSSSYYEDLVQFPDKHYIEICDFLEVPYESSAIERALGELHLPGRGDRKVVVSDHLSTESIGRGSAVPIQMIPPTALAHLNSLLSVLNYTELDETWNRQASPLGSPRD